MTRRLLLALMVMMSCHLMAQETLTGWTFPSATAPDSLNADLGTTQNKTYDIRFQWALSPTNDSTVNTITFVDGATTLAAATTGWENGMDYKFWSIKFKANNYTDFKLSSKQKSDAANPGPRDFKIQWRLSSTNYSDVPNGTVTVASDWSTGVVTNLPVPITGQGSGSIYIRWVMASNNNIAGGTVTPAGQSMIDDILVTGANSLGQNEILYTNRLKITPTPNNGRFTLISGEPLEELTVVDMNGNTIVHHANPSQKQFISLPDPKPGMYLLKVRFFDEEFLTTRFVVE